MTVIGTLRHANGSSLGSWTAIGTRECKLVRHIPGSGQYKFEFVPPFASPPAVTANHVWSTTNDDWGGSASDRAAIEFVTSQFVGIVTANDRGTLVDRSFSMIIVGS